MRILITGGSGFIGSHLVTELAAAGHAVWTLDRARWDLFGRKVDFHRDLLGWRIPGTTDLRDAWAVPGEDFRSWPDSAPLEEAMIECEPEVVVHLAAQVGRQFGEDAPAIAALDNVGMTALVARTCARAMVRLVYASTSEVYGDVGDRVAQEDAEAGLAGSTWAALYADLPHNIYGLTKRQAEEVAALYATWHGGRGEPWINEAGGLQVVRPSMPYGPGLPPGRGRAAIVNFLWNAMHDAPLTVHRGAERSWCWIGDCVRGIRLVIEEGEVAFSHAEWRDGRGCYNVGRDDAGVPMKDVAYLALATVRRLVGPEQIELVDPPARQTIVKRLSTAKLRTLGWEPVVDLEEGMRWTFDWLVKTREKWAAPAR